jgi:hypothetical protein
MNSAGTSSWEESEKENYYAHAPVVPPKTELEALVNFLSKFDSKVAAIWGNEGEGVKDHNNQAVWGQPAAPEDEEEDLLTSGKTHFKPIREREEPCFGFWSVEDPAEYATFQRTANSAFPLRFKVKSVNDKAVQTDPTLALASPEQQQTEGEMNYWTTTGIGLGLQLGIGIGIGNQEHHHQLQLQQQQQQFQQQLQKEGVMVSWQMESD